MLRRSLPALLLTFAISSCSSAPLTIDEGSIARVEVSVTAPSLEVPRGGVLLINANITRLGGFDGDATLFIDGIPMGIRAQTSAVETIDGISNALIAVAVDPSVPLGNYELTVRAVAPGLSDASTKLIVTVDAAGTPVYTLSSRPFSVVRGGSASGFASIDRGANTLDVPVTLTATNVPTGVVVTIYPTTNFKALSTMTVAVSAGVAPGHYTFTLRGVAPGMADRIAVIPLTVLAGP